MEKETADHRLIELLNNPKSKKEGVAALINTYQMPLYWHIRKMVVNHDDSKDVSPVILTLAKILFAIIDVKDIGTKNVDGLYDARDARNHAPAVPGGNSDWQSCREEIILFWVPRRM